ncbi:secretion system protein [Verrucomicrobia bacterium IMCC26134]|nr:secretion system protein [Verrucomicrobia bacterium IMCC26134]
MPTFTYRARDAAGATSSGSMDAPSRRDALRRLQTRNLQPISLEESSGAKPARAKSTAGASSSNAAKPALTSSSASKVPADPTSKECLPFLEAISDLVRGGLSAGEAIRLLSVRVQQPRLRTLCTALWAALSEGQTLSVALAAHPQVFDGQTINLVAAGEATGNLRDVLDRLIAHFTEQQELRAKLIGALAYPVFVCLLAGGVILFFLFFLLPRLRGLLTSLGGELPFATKILVNLSEFTLHYGAFALIAGVIAFISFWQWRRTAAGRLAADELALRMPIVKGYAVRSSVLNFAHTLAVLLENGITTAEALRLAEKTIANEAVRARLRESTDRVLEGESLSLALGRTGIFAPLLLDRLAVSEQTGNLAPGLRDIARTCRNDLDRWLNTFTKSISAGVLVVAFSFVAFIAYAIVSAVFQVSASFRF